MKSQAFQDQMEEAESDFIESLEWRLVRAGKKGNVLALLAVLNAQHPQYGRLRYEAVIRFLGPLLEKVYNLIRKDLGDRNGEALCAKIRELFDKALSKLSD